MTTPVDAARGPLTVSVQFRGSLGREFTDATVSVHPSGALHIVDEHGTTTYAPGQWASFETRRAEQ